MAVTVTEKVFVSAPDVVSALTVTEVPLAAGASVAAFSRTS
ncbi:hypothetical protein [Catellatospora chokoriensis]|nr:hypothetical protein [Catellatospora chokoriensis]